MYSYDGTGGIVLRLRAPAGGLDFVPRSRWRWIPSRVSVSQTLLRFIVALFGGAASESASLSASLVLGRGNPSVN